MARDVLQMMGFLAKERRAGRNWEIQVAHDEMQECSDLVCRCEPVFVLTHKGSA